MIDIDNISSKGPYLKFYDCYKEALAMNQDYIEAICVSSQYDNKVDSRFVNLKFIIDDQWIFFSNYRSPKGIQIENNNDISCIFFWNKTNTQIRIKAKAKKTEASFSDSYFKNRDYKKNALAISSKQSVKTDSYDDILSKYKEVLKYHEDLGKRPDYWGGFSFTPYYFEFWQGHQSRINKREVFEKNSDDWEQYFLQP